MTEIVKHSGNDYVIKTLIAHKTTAVLLKAQKEHCVVNEHTVVMEGVDTPIVVKQDERLVVLVMSAGTLDKEILPVRLFSKILLKKAKYEAPIAPRIQNHMSNSNGYGYQQSNSGYGYNRNRNY